MPKGLVQAMKIFVPENWAEPVISCGVLPEARAVFYDSNRVMATRAVEWRRLVGHLSAEFLQRI